VLGGVRHLGLTVLSALTEERCPTLWWGRRRWWCRAPSGTYPGIQSDHVSVDHLKVRRAAHYLVCSRHENPPSLWLVAAVMVGGGATRDTLQRTRSDHMNVNYLKANNYPTHYLACLHRDPQPFRGGKLAIMVATASRHHQRRPPNSRMAAEDVVGARTDDLGVNPPKAHHLT